MGGAKLIGLIPYWGEIGMGFFLTTGEAGSEEKKFPHESRKAHFIFPTNGLAGVVKKNFPKSGEAASGEIFFTTTAKPWVGKIKCALSDEWGNLPIPISPQ